jgi:hypothetical protein
MSRAVEALKSLRVAAGYQLMIGKNAGKIAKEEARSMMQFKRAARDSLYIFLDSWKTMKRAHKDYDAFHRYINQAAKGKINPDDFRDVNLGNLKQILSDYRQVRGPLTSFDMRWFYWMYAFMFVNILYSMYELMQLQARREQVQGSMKQRKDFIED